METKFTKDQWHNNDFDRMGAIEIVAGTHTLARVYVRMSKGMGTGCTTEDVQEAAANARLMTHAPEMFAALQSIVQLVSDSPEFVPMVDSPLAQILHIAATAAIESSSTPAERQIRIEEENYGK